MSPRQKCEKMSQRNNDIYIFFGGGGRAGGTTAKPSVTGKLLSSQVLDILRLKEEIRPSMQKQAKETSAPRSSFLQLEKLNLRSKHSLLGIILRLKARAKSTVQDAIRTLERYD